MLKPSQKKPVKKPLLRAVRFRIMPLTVTMLSLVLLIKINDVYIGSRELDNALTIRSAKASEPAKEVKTAQPATEKKSGR